MKQKHLAAKLQDIKTDGEGQFDALVAVYGNVDYQGDRIMPGAFAESLKAWKTKGDPIPVIFSHDWGDLWSHIGYVDPGDAKETPRGLMVRGHLDVADNPTAAQAFRLMKRRMLKEFSITSDIIAERPGQDGANELTKLDLIEVGPTLKGANPETQLLAVKGMLEESVGRHHTADLVAKSALLESIVEDAVRRVLAERDAAPPVVDEVKAEEPARAKAEEPSTDDIRAALAELLDESDTQEESS